MPFMNFKRPTFHFPHPERGRSVVATVLRALALLLALAITWLLVILAMGIPASWIREIEARLPETPFVAEAETISYDLFRGVLLRDARIYRKGDVGLPLVSAATVRLGIDPLAALSGGDWLQEVWIEGGTIRRMEGGLPVKGAEPPDMGKWDFRLEVENTRVFGERVDHGSADVSLYGGQARLSRAEGEIGERGGPRASLQGSLVLDIAARRYNANLTWSGQLLAVEALLTELKKTTTLAYLRQFQPGPKVPNGDVEIEGAYGEDWSFGLKLTGSARNCAFRGVDMRQIFLNMHVQTGNGKTLLLSFDPVVMIREDGLAAGGFSVELATGDIRFDGYSTCPPATLARLIVPSLEESLTQVRVEGPFRIHAGGTANFRDYTRQAVTFFLEGQKVGVKRFLADRIACTARLTGTSFEVHDISGECYGGSFTGSVDVVAAWTPEKKLDKVQFAMEGGVQNIDGQTLGVALGRKAPEQYAGRFDMAGRVSGMLGGDDPLRNLRGAGWLRFRQGRLFRIPLFDPLSDFLARLIPGLNPGASLTDASADWKLEDGQVRSEAIAVGGDMVNLSGHGSFALTNSLAYDIQIKLMKTDSLLGKAVRTLTLPMSKLFEFRLVGTTEKPHWYPVNFSADLFDRMSRGGRAPGGKASGPDKGTANEGGAGL
jgi:hypothetical protein